MTPRRAIPRPRLILAAGAAIAVILAIRLLQPHVPKIDPDDADQVALGQSVYAAQCARCDGANLEGQPNWQQRLANGRLPAPPHDAGGHSWHHPDAQLFGITKHGLAPYAPACYQSDMPAFDGVLSDEQIAAVPAYIKSKWPADIRERQACIDAEAERQ